MFATGADEQLDIMDAMLKRPIYIYCIIFCYYIIYVIYYTLLLKYKLTFYFVRMFIETPYTSRPPHFRLYLAALIASRKNSLISQILGPSVLTPTWG